jgi:acetylglutamate kinase
MPTDAQAAVNGPEVVHEVNLGLGDASAWAWGCDLSYDYVSINAVSKSEHLETHSPGLKRRLLVEALSYIHRFAGKIAVIKYAGAAMQRDDLKDAFAEDLVLLKASGLLPVVVHEVDPKSPEPLSGWGRNRNSSMACG